MYISNTLPLQFYAMSVIHKESLVTTMFKIKHRHAIHQKRSKIIQHVRVQHIIDALTKKLHCLSFGG